MIFCFLFLLAFFFSSTCSGVCSFFSLTFALSSSFFTRTTHTHTGTLFFYSSSGFLLFYWLHLGLLLVTNKTALTVAQLLFSCVISWSFCFVPLAINLHTQQPPTLRRCLCSANCYLLLSSKCCALATLSVAGISRSIYNLH